MDCVDGFAPSVGREAPPCVDESHHHRLTGLESDATLLEALVPQRVECGLDHGSAQGALEGEETLLALVLADTAWMGEVPAHGGEKNWKQRPRVESGGCCWRLS